MTLVERGTLIIEARKSKNYSTEQMSELLSMSNGTYLKIESGEKDPTTQESNKLINILDLDPSLFYTKNVIINGDNSPGVIGYGNNVTFDKEVIDLLKLSIESTNASMKHNHNVESSLMSLTTNINDLVSSMKILIEKIGR